MTIKMKKFHVFVVAAVLLALISIQGSESASIEYDRLSGAPYLTKRSLCNTFGGCGAKRSLRSLLPQTGGEFSNESSDGAQNTLINNYDTSGLKSSSSQFKRDASADLVAEILNDLMEYLHYNEKYKQGKYAVLVPTKPTDNLQLNPASLAIISSSGQLQKASANDLQEFQLG